jgi:hypothetical protein
MEPFDGKLDEEAALLRLIADSEKARQAGRWITQEQMEKKLHERFGV